MLHGAQLLVCIYKESPNLETIESKFLKNLLEVPYQFNALT